MQSLAMFFRTLLPICVLTLPAFGNPIPVVIDGDFVGWQSLVLLEQGQGQGIVTRQTTGGNPDACLDVSTRSGWELAMWALMWKNDFTWDPATSGPIERLSLQIDEKAIDSFGAGQNVKLLVVQDGRYYGAPLDPWVTASGVGTTWETIYLGTFEESDFFECLPWPRNPDETPDFSGAPMQFGFMVGVSSVLDARIHAYDNWELVIYPPPIAVEARTWGEIKADYR